MAFRVRILPAATLLLSMAPAWCQQAVLPNNTAPIVQPGAPGTQSRTLTAATASTRPNAPIQADIEFMQAMAIHHAQAVEMVDLLRTRGRDKAVQLLGQRITISQTDEIQYMKQWLADHGAPVAPEHGHMHHMAGMNSNDPDVPLMPGMLSPNQMKALAKASGRAFDQLFLTGMIQHHNGALLMVDELFATPGAGQDNALYDFATDIDNTQRAEIKIMQGMLAKERNK